MVGGETTCTVGYGTCAFSRKKSKSQSSSRGFDLRLYMARRTITQQGLCYAFFAAGKYFDAKLFILCVCVFVDGGGRVFSECCSGDDEQSFSQQ